MTDLAPDAGSPAAADTILDDDFIDSGALAELDLEDGDAGEGGEGEGAGEDELEDYEEDGKSFKLPKGFGARLMKDADYTQKTQALSAEREQVDAGRRAVIAQAESHRALLGAAAKVMQLNEQLAAYEKVTPEQWATAHAQDPDQVSAARLQMQLLREERERAVTDLQTKDRERLEAGQRETAKAIEQRDAVLARDIKGWTKESLPKLADDAKAFGITKDEVLGTTDPRAIKVLRMAALGLKLQAKAKAAQNVQQAQVAAPARRVGVAAPRTGLSDSLSGDEWDRRREAQVAARRQAQGR